MTDELWPTVPELAPPGLMDGTPPSRRFDGGESAPITRFDQVTFPVLRAKAGLPPISAMCTTHTIQGVIRMQAQNGYMSAGTGQVGYPQGVVTANQLQPQSAIAANTASLSESNLRLYQLVAKARQIADDYFGGQPESGSKEGVAPIGSAKQDALAAETRAFAILLGQLETQIDRLTCV